MKKVQGTAFGIGVLLAAAVFVFAGCDNGSGGGSSYISVTGVTLDRETLDLAVGTNSTLTAAVAPANATNNAVTWSSSDETIATVADGVVTAIAPGSATITVTTADGGRTATCAVTVPALAEDVTATVVTLTPNPLSLVVGTKRTLKASVAPAPETDPTFIWVIDKDAVATVAGVDDAGEVTAVTVGTATITVTATITDGEKTATYTATCAVTVTESKVDVEDVTLTPATLSLGVGANGTLTATVVPPTATDDAVTWSSSKEEVATVSGGVVTAVGPGTATITVKTVDGEKTETCEVTVTVPVPVTGVTLDAALSLAVGANGTLTATVAPSGATNKTVTWSTSKDTVATVDADGEVTAVGPGTATITVTTADGGETATCAVTVTATFPPSRFSIGGNYTGPATITYYGPAATLEVNVTASGDLENSSGAEPTGSIKSITVRPPGGEKEYLIGRSASDGIPIALNLSPSGELLFRMDGALLIGSYAEFQKINDDPGAMRGYKQEADLDLMDEEWRPVGNSAQPFAGTYDGNGKTVTNLRINNPTSTDPVGLFGSVNNGVIRNLGIASGTVTGGDNVGGIAGNSDGNITACYNNAEVSGNDNVGGIAGYSYGNITACYNSGEVNGSGNVGGIAGYSEGEITACYNSGTVSGTGPNIGGIVGDNDNGIMIGCYWKDTNPAGAGTGSVGGSAFSTPFDPGNTGEWGTGDGLGSGKYWLGGIDYTTQLPKLWFEQ